MHDLRTDECLPPGFQKATLFYLPTAAVIPTFMVNFGAKLPLFENFLRSSFGL